MNQIFQFFHQTFVLYGVAHYNYLNHLGVRNNLQL